MPNDLRNYLIHIFFLLLLLCSPSLVMASCTASGAFTINPGTVIVQRDAVVGQPLSDWFESGQIKDFTQCNYDQFTRYDIQNGIKSYNAHASGISYSNETIFDTNIAGVGFILEGRSSFNGLAWTSWLGIPKGHTEFDIIAASHNRGDRPYFTDQARIRLIKTGDIKPGSLSGNIGKFFAGVRDANSWSYEVPITFNGGQIITATCSVTTPDISVPLGQYKKSDFAGPGAGTKWQSFSIGLNCDKGAKINVRIDASSTQAPGVMKLDTSDDKSVADGIGIQVSWGTDGSSPVTFGEDTARGSAGSDGPITVPLQARYYQTGQSVTAGAANATATFTVTYK